MGGGVGGGGGSVGHVATTPGFFLLSHSFGIEWYDS